MTQTKGWKYGLVLLAAVTGCDGDAKPVASSSTLGIVQFDVRESATGIEITGRDARGALIGALALRLGTVVMPDDGRVAEGRQLTVEVRGKKVEHVSTGSSPLVLPLSAAMLPQSAFLSDPHVAPVLERWGIRLARPTGALASGEKAYDACGYELNPSCGAADCCEYYNGGVYENVCCDGTQAMVNRSCSVDPTSACGENGTRGCAICWTIPYDGGSCVIQGCQGYIEHGSGWPCDDSSQCYSGCDTENGVCF